MSGNFLTAAPLGTINGIDYQWTGRVRRIHVERIHNLLGNGDIVILGNLGFSPFGELYNCSSIEVAAHCAIQLQASKLIFLHEGETLIDSRRGDDSLISNLSISDAKAFVNSMSPQPSTTTTTTSPKKTSTTTTNLNIISNEIHQNLNRTFRLFLKGGIYACEKGVKRTHMVSRYQNGGLYIYVYIYT